jgi:drug/metabolite transporter (DMT)-like permease
VTNIQPLILGISRTVVLTLCLGAFALLLGELAWPSNRALLWLAGGSFFGPFLSYFLFYKGMVSLDIGQAAIIRATQPLFVALYSFVLLGALVSRQQFVGGMVILAGVVMILWSNRSAQPLKREWPTAQEYQKLNLEEKIPE